MSHATISNRSQLFAAATAITAVGFLTHDLDVHTSGAGHDAAGTE